MKRSELLCKLALNEEVVQVNYLSVGTSKPLTKIKLEASDNTSQVVSTIDEATPGSRPTIKKASLGLPENVSTSLDTYCSAIDIVEPGRLKTSTLFKGDQVVVSQLVHTSGPSCSDVKPRPKCGLSERCCRSTSDIVSFNSSIERKNRVVLLNKGLNGTPVITEPTPMKETTVDSDSSLEVYDSDCDPEYFPEESTRKPTRSKFEQTILRFKCNSFQATNLSRPTESAPSTDRLRINVSNLTQTVNEPANSNVTGEPAVKKVTRWKKPNSEQWKINTNKAKRRSGFPYKSKTKKDMPAKAPKLVDCSTCFYKCSNTISLDDRKMICAE